MMAKVSPTAATRIAAIAIASRLRRPRIRKRSATVGEPVPHRADRLDRRGAARAGELSPQISHVDLHDVRAGVEVITPDRAQDLLTGQDLVPVPEEVGQQVELPCREGHLAASVAHPALEQVDSDVATGEHCGLRLIWKA